MWLFSLRCFFSCIYIFIKEKKLLKKKQQQLYNKLQYDHDIASSNLVHSWSTKNIQTMMLLHKLSSGLLFLESAISSKFYSFGNPYFDFFKTLLVFALFWIILRYHSQKLEVFCKNRCSWKFRIFYRKPSVLESLFNKFADLRACHFIKKKLQRKCFPVKLEKLLSGAILKNIYERLLLHSVHACSIWPFLTMIRLNMILKTILAFSVSNVSNVSISH